MENKIGICELSLDNGEKFECEVDSAIEIDGKLYFLISRTSETGEEYATFLKQDGEEVCDIEDEEELRFVAERFMECNQDIQFE